MLLSFGGVDWRKQTGRWQRLAPYRIKMEAPILILYILSGAWLVLLGFAIGRISGARWQHGIERTFSEFRAKCAIAKLKRITARYYVGANAQN
jgi:hypothetical protein